MSAGHDKPTGGLGTFAGVITPSLLTILGLILFRRLGWAVGAGGLLPLLGILAVAHVISIVTSTSLAAIATNLRARGGGDYYLISRSLGVEFGGALGVVLFVAQSVSVAFYCIGLGEAVAPMLPEHPLVSSTSVSLAAVSFLFLFAWAGSDWATRLQYLVMATLVGALGTFFWGASRNFDPLLLEQGLSSADPEGPGFWVLFALIFPAVTGFTQGVSMSGDLKDPSKSLPGGTFTAVFVALAVYLVAAVAFAGSLPAGDLTADYEAMGRIALHPSLVIAGLIAATLSSALASFMGAPRILQALASDRIFPALTPFAQGHGEGNNPRRGVLLTAALALGCVVVGGVDVIAPVVSMFFLISYGLLNYATALEGRSNSPSFRPRFRWFDWRLSLAGALACLGVMIMISPWASMLALGLLAVLYHSVGRVAGPDRWADSRRDHYYHGMRKNLLALSREPVHSRNWRPHLLALSETNGRLAPLARFASWIEGGSGLTTVVRVTQGTDDVSGVAARRAARDLLAEELSTREIEAFPLVLSAPDRSAATRALVQGWGLGPVDANTLLLDWREQSTRDGKARGVFARDIREAIRLGVNVVVFDGTDEDLRVLEDTPPERRRIDVWWSDNRTGRLMLLLAYMTTRTDAWSGASIRLLVPTNKRAQEGIETRLRRTLEDVRVDAEVLPVVDADPDKLLALSRDAALAFMPLLARGPEAVDMFGRPVEPLLSALRAVGLVAAVDDIALDASPEQGQQGTLAELSDEADALNRKLAALQPRLAPARAAVTRQRQSAETLLVQLDAETDEARRKALQDKVNATMQEAAASERTLREIEQAIASIHRRDEQIEKHRAALKRPGRAANV